MFFVYGTSGQLFRGSMEQLRQIRGVGSLARTRRVEALGRDGREVSEDTGAPSLVARESASGHGFDTSRPAPLSAYLQTQQGTAQRRPLSLVADVMSHQPITLPDSATVMQAWQLLADQSVGQAPVLNAAGQLVGLLTRADLLQPQQLPDPTQHALVWKALLARPVTAIMATPVPSVTAESDIRRVAQVLLDTGLPGLPVVDEQGQVSGFISRSDILRAVVTDPPLDLWG
jgi:CBS-domain-containing membrane protein